MNERGPMKPPERSHYPRSLRGILMIAAIFLHTRRVFSGSEA